MFDLNLRELRLAGNSLRLLTFLCENKPNATITEIGGYLDWAKDYNENQLRQYRYKVNIIVGHDVIEYKNGVYSLVGSVETIAELPKEERITQDEQYIPLYSVGNMSKKTFKKWLLFLVPATLLAGFIIWKIVSNGSISGGSPTENIGNNGCNKNYSGCLSKKGDYDCLGGNGDGPNFTGKVQVLGYDEYKLDRDGNGIACE